MEKRPVFGRRGAAQQRYPASRTNSFAASPAPDASGDMLADAPRDRFGDAFAGDAARAESASPSLRPRDPVEAELEEWKANRKKLPLIAWRPLYLMASACFGLAYFVLPDSINDIVQWPLYALAAVSFYLGMKMRREKRAAKKAAKQEEAAQSAA